MPPRVDRSQELARRDEELRSARGARHLVGVDEAGRGPWAGPVVAAAVVLDPSHVRSLGRVRDSKVLSPARRDECFEAVRRAALAVGVGWAHSGEIDSHNILQATFMAMRRAVARLRLSEGSGVLVAVDGNQSIPSLVFPQCTFVDGDALSLSIASASIVAKVVRDRWMRRLDVRFPGYGFAEHKGYGTPVHQEALRRLGPCPIHRRTFEPIRALSRPQGARIGAA